MAFNSFGFLFLFFPIFFILYRLLPRKYCTLALCVGGLAFTPSACTARRGSSCCLPA